MYNFEDISILILLLSTMQIYRELRLICTILRQMVGTENNLSLSISLSFEYFAVISHTVIA